MKRLWSSKSIIVIAKQNATNTPARFNCKHTLVSPLNRLIVRESHLRECRKLNLLVTADIISFVQSTACEFYKNLFIEFCDRDQIVRYELSKS